MSSLADGSGVLVTDEVQLAEALGSCENGAASSDPSDSIAAQSSPAFSTLTTHGGLYLGLRYGLGVLISIGNMFVLTWWIGPHAYGVFVTAIGLTAFLGSLTRSGIDTYLVRRAAPPHEDMYHVASTLIGGFSIVLMVVGAALIPLLARWYGNREFVSPYTALLLAVPIVGLAGPPTAKLERALEFRAVAQIELGSQLLALAVGLTLAWRGLGVWAPVLGHLTWQGSGLAAAFWKARFIPRARFEGWCVREMLSFGAGYTASLRTWQLRTLVNPLLVGRFAGSEGVAFVGLAIRIAEGLGFIRIAAARLAIAGLARLQDNREKLRAAIEKALEIQVLVLGPLLCAFALLGPLLVPRLMGARWMPSLQVYPFIASGVLVNSVFNLQASALFVVGEQWVVLKAYATHVLLLVLGTFLLIPHVGLSGYGWADLLACLAYAFLHRGLARVVGISQRRLLPLAVAFVALLFVPSAGRLWFPALSLPLLLLMITRSWNRTVECQNRCRTSGSWAAKRANAGLRHLLTFLLKTRYRGVGYVMAVGQYVLRRRGYRTRIALSRLVRRDERIGPSGVCGQSCRETASVRGQCKFHFSIEEIPAIVASIPDPLKRRTVAEAEQILSQQFCYRGLTQVFADEVDWEACPRGNSSWTWDLNRHRSFVTLSTAYHYTGQTKYLIKLVELWGHWINKNPVARTRAWKQPFEVAARLQNWIWAYFLLEGAPRCDRKRLPCILSAMREHGIFLYSNLEYHWPNNHLLLEAKALFEYALLFPDFKESEKLLARAERILRRQLADQVLDDGGHSELCSMYHRIVAGELGELASICRRNETPLSAEIEQGIEKLTGFTAALLRDDGSAPLLGDSAQTDSYLRFDPADREYSDLNYWVWREDRSSPYVCPSDGRPLRRAIYPKAGYAFLRDGRGEREFHLIFDFGLFSRCNSANHAHCDALSFELYAAGQPLIVDPGICLPWNDGLAWARYFRSTAAHNTLTIDGKEQSELCRYADVRRTARTRLTDLYVSGKGTGISGECVPYWAVKDGISHIRKICRDGDGIITIRDEVTGSGRHRLDWNFQFAADIELIKLGDDILLARTGAGSDLLRLQLTANTVPTLILARGQTNPPRGWISRDGWGVLPAYAALFSAEVELPFAITFQITINS